MGAAPVSQQKGQPCFSIAASLRSLTNAASGMRAERIRIESGHCGDCVSCELTADVTRGNEMQISRCLAALAALLLSGVAPAAEPTEPDPGFVTVPVSGTVSVLQGHDCPNIAVSVGDDGMVMVDACASKFAEQLLASLQRLSDKPLKFVIDTHAHGDHTLANAFFQKLAPVIAHDNVRKRLAAGNEKTGDKPRPLEALPIVTLESELIL